jgi:O-6-methylguanine DNA methyltransferase
MFRISRALLLGALTRLRREETSRLLAGCSTSFETCNIGAPPPFTQEVFRFIARIPCSETVVMDGLRAKAANPRPRAVGKAPRRNLLPILIPCHCIVRAGGAIDAFALGSKCKGNY